MSGHPTPDALALLALGERVDGHEHLTGCSTCRSIVRAWQEVADVACAPEELRAPPSRVWRRVVARTRVDAPVTVGPLGWSARASSRMLALAAGLVLIAGVPAVLLGVWQEPQPVLVGDVELESLRSGAQGTVQLVEDARGLTLAVETGSLPAVGEGYYEVWLLDEAITQLVSLGPLSDGEALRLPDGIDLGTYAVVDVSLEAFDGDPTHSGDSVLRGPLPAERR